MLLLIYGFFLLWAGGLFGATCKDLQVIRHTESTRSYLAVVRDNKQATFILKQRKQNRVPEQFACAVDKLGSLMAQELGIPCNTVDIIPISACLPYKFHKDSPATLHSFISGVSRLVGLCQRYKPIKNSEGIGLTLTVIRDMARHPGLPELVALDTFICNTDRNRSNLILNETENKFYAIDFGNAFSVNLCKLAIDNIKFYLSKKITLTRAEKDSLRVYRDMLNHLKKKYSPQVLYERLEAYAKEAGFFDNGVSLPRAQHVKRLLSRCRSVIEESYASVPRLIKLVNKLIKRG
jgi:hypothetical protein